MSRVTVQEITGPRVGLIKGHKGLWFCIGKKNLLETLFSSIKITLFYCVRQGLGIRTIFCAIGCSVPASSSNQAVEWGWEMEASRCTKIKIKTLSDQTPPQKMGGRMKWLSALSHSVWVYVMHMHQHTQSQSFISYILLFNTENDCLPSFWFLFFFLTVLKYLKCIDCWLSFKNKTKPFELYYKGWHCSGMGQSFLQFFSYHLMILVQELEIFLFIPW